MECKQKIPYKTKKIAKKERNILQDRYNRKYAIYKCPECKEYHLSTDLNTSRKIFHRIKKLKDREESV